MEDESPAKKREWLQVVQDEMGVVNRQMEEWKKKEGAAKIEKQREDEEKRKRKAEAEFRQKKRDQAAGSTADGSRLVDRRQTIAIQVASAETALSNGQKADDPREALGGDTEKVSAAEKAEQIKRRKEQAELEEPKLYYTFMGEAYIHGMMDGEAVREHIVDGLPERYFEIR